MVNNKDNIEYLCLGTIGLLSLPIGNVMFSKPAYLSACFSDKYLFSEHQISAGKLSADSSSTETIYCLNR